MREKLNHKDLSVLWEAIKKSDRLAFQQLFEMLYGEMIAFGLTIHFDRPAVKDTIQDVFLELWKKRNQLPIVQNHRAYLKQILKRKLLRVANQQAKITATSTKASSTASYETLLIAQQKDEENKQKILKAFGQLSTRQKEIIQLRFFQGLSYDAIAEQTNTQKRTVYNQIHSALKILKKAMLLQILFFFS